MASGRAAARDTRHGRRGGGWIDEPRPAAASEPKVKLIRLTCPHCATSFLAEAGPDGTTATEHCGSIVCTAVASWPPERWAGAARMARARAHAGAQPGPLDDLALRYEDGRP